MTEPRANGADEWRVPRAALAVGAAIGVSAFLVFEWYFIPPRGTLSIANPIDWLLMLPFVVAGVLLTRAVRDARVRREREEADRLKDALIASVSHDLRTPLTTIRALAHELGALGDERSQVIEEQAERLNRYVQDLLDLSRLKAGAMPVRIEINALDDLLSAVIDETVAIVESRPLDVTLPQGELLAGRFDLALSIRIVANLVDNAVKYSPAGATVTVDAARIRDRLVVRVGDRGMGVPVAERERIFEPFHRAGDARTTDRGAGLGLAIGRRMAEVQGGSLTCDARDGGGTWFTLSLPAVAAADAAAAAAADFVKS